MKVLSLTGGIRGMVQRILARTTAPCKDTKLPFTMEGWRDYRHSLRPTASSSRKSERSHAVEQSLNHKHKKAGLSKESGSGQDVSDLKPPSSKGGLEGLYNRRQRHICKIGTQGVKPSKPKRPTRQGWS